MLNEFQSNFSFNFNNISIGYLIVKNKKRLARAGMETVIFITEVSLGRRDVVAVFLRKK